MSRDLNIRDGFMVTALFWVVLGLFGAIPLGWHPNSLSPLWRRFSNQCRDDNDWSHGHRPRSSASLAAFVSTTAAMARVSELLFAVAILPMGIGGMQLYRAESAGPSKDRKLTPRITSTAKALFGIYFLLTLACSASYVAAGMSPFDALCHAFSTVAIGGFSTHDASLGHYGQNSVLLVSSVFMVLSAINFGLHFLSLQRRNIRVYSHDSETAFFITVIALASVVCYCYSRQRP